MKYKDWLETWLEVYVKPVVKTQTYEKYERNVRLHVLPVLGGYKLEQLSAGVLQCFVASLDNMASNTVNSVITVVQKSLKTALRFGAADKYCADRIIRPKTVEKRVECFTLAEQRKIERAVLESDKPRLMGIVICLYTGLRLGELLALRRSDVDLKSGLLSVDKSSYYGRDAAGKYSIITGPPKTADSVRIIPIPRQLLPHIRGLIAKADGDFVISCRGEPVKTRTYQYDFENLLKSQGIPHRGFHSLRHTFATRAIECGMDVKTLSEILGHKNASVTINRYAHSLIAHKREVMNRLGKLLD